MEQYDFYKDSGVEWIGEIPEHWEVKRGKNFFGLVSERATGDRKKIALENIVSGVGKLKESDTEFDGEGIAYEKDDILYGKLRPYLAKVYRAEEAGAAVGDFYVFRCKYKVYPGYAFYTLLNQAFTDVASNSTYGAKMPRVSWDFISSLNFTVPNFDEQKAIVLYLDDHTQKLDRLIKNKKKQIARLKELRQIEINNAVTKGLNPDVPLKDSGVEWLGQIPEHWEVKRVKQIVATKITDGPHETPVFIEEGIPFISAEAIKSNSINFDKKRGYISQELHELYSKKCKPQREDIFIIKSGATTGNIAYVDTDIEFSIWSPLALVRCNKQRAYFKYIYYQFLSDSFRKQIELGWSFGTQENIGMGVIEKLFLALPPCEEQVEIIAQLDDRVKKVDQTITTLEVQISQLQEVREIEIFNAVTGKVKVPARYFEQQEAGAIV